MNFLEKFQKWKIYGDIVSVQYIISKTVFLKIVVFLKNARQYNFISRYKEVTG